MDDIPPNIYAEISSNSARIRVHGYNWARTHVADELGEEPLLAEVCIVGCQQVLVCQHELACNKLESSRLESFNDFPYKTPLNCIRLQHDESSLSIGLVSEGPRILGQFCLKFCFGIIALSFIWPSWGLSNHLASSFGLCSFWFLRCSFRLGCWLNTYRSLDCFIITGKQIHIFRRFSLLFSLLQNKSFLNLSSQNHGRHSYYLRTSSEHTLKL